MIECKKDPAYSLMCSTLLYFADRSLNDDYTALLVILSPQFEPTSAFGAVSGHPQFLGSCTSTSGVPVHRA